MNIYTLYGFILGLFLGGMNAPLGIVLILYAIYSIPIYWCMLNED
ncbi:hypothetical protein [Erwinia phage FBB1]|nr:hypothetical protein [Erwinia phage FBB1]